jgi:serine/threonine protein kinase
VLGLDQNSIVKEGTLLKDPDFHVAIKTVNYKHRKYYHTIIQEILALKQVDHPCIVKLFEVYKDDENFYLVMEKVEGVTLAKIMKLEDQTTEKDTSKIIEQLLKIV